jgi:pimeloyl-ACP methyl ester carboxylesterase
MVGTVYTSADDRGKVVLKFSPSFRNPEPSFSPIHSPSTTFHQCHHSSPHTTELNTPSYKLTTMHSSRALVIVGTGVVTLLSASFGLASSFVIQPHVWEYKTHDVGYEVATTTVPTTTSRQQQYPVWNQTTLLHMGSYYDVYEKENAVMTATSTCPETTSNDQVEAPILLLNGFGVGSFHQHRLISCLLKKQSDHVDINSSLQRKIYCMDYLGQGRSWPKDCQDGLSISEQGFQYSAETWIDQTITFIEQVILLEHQSQQQQPQKLYNNKIHLVGNSVGGHLAAYIATRRPDLIESICLLNPTPVWGLNLPGWSGMLPAPFLPKLIGRFLFDRIRDLKTIEKFLEQTYSRREAFTEELVRVVA